ncbi:hypothetical protein LSH36_175g00035 [Paralvinella palmiformis]|uniref:Phospholipid scramblase n=1 Tax=Paralvinella palmiformis TaxID=53620 RepID=A0AAD9JS10_9ANNE|nr:hypothetical protein LSH36_175g00035 [Paralvinella palmiformis]
MDKKSTKPVSRPKDIPLLSKSAHNATDQTELKSPVGEGLIGLRYIDDVGSQENILRAASVDGLDLKLNPIPFEILPANDDKLEEDAQNRVVTGQPSPHGLCQPPGLEPLLDTAQVVVHMGNLRQDIIIKESAVKRMEIINETRKVLFHVEQDEEDLPTNSSFRFRIYNRSKEEVIQVYSPSSSTCMCCGASWHCMKRCRFEAMIYSPPGTVAGFVRRSRTKFVQEFQILNAAEEPLLTLRGGPQDLEIYSLDLRDELGRFSVHGWAGIMHEIRRTSSDYGMTFPIDLDVRVKAVLIGAIFAIHWLYSTKGGKKK